MKYANQAFKRTVSSKHVLITDFIRLQIMLTIDRVLLARLHMLRLKWAERTLLIAILFF